MTLTICLNPVKEKQSSDHKEGDNPSPIDPHFDNLINCINVSYKKAKVRGAYCYSYCFGLDRGGQRNMENAESLEFIYCGKLYKQRFFFLNN